MYKFTLFSTPFTNHSTWEQTILAAQQLGIIVGVALLVGGGFMLMVGLEIGAGWALDKIYKLCGKKIQENPEDPAALVGSFKRYKWFISIKKLWLLLWSSTLLSDAKLNVIWPLTNQKMKQWELNLCCNYVFIEVSLNNIEMNGIWVVLGSFSWNLLEGIIDFTGYYWMDIYKNFTKRVVDCMWYHVVLISCFS